MTFSDSTEVAAQNQTAIVVGAGPTGTLMALILAQMNWKVSVYERRDSYSQLNDNQNRRSYNIVLFSRGLRALKQAGVTLPTEQSVVLKGNVRHSTKGAKKSPGFSEAVSVNRNILAQHLLKEGITRFPEHIKYYFNHRLEGINFEQKLATFQIEEKQVSQSFDLLVGADGVFSTVREIIVQQFDEFSADQNHDQMTFKICQLGKATNFTNSTPDWEECFHTWPNTQPVTMLAPPNPDGTLTGVLILPQQSEITFDKIKTENDINALFSAKFPDIFMGKPIPQDWVEDLLAQKVSLGGITTICNHFHAGNSVVLVGDAAHSVWASLGQGCNVALESCRILAEILEAHNNNLPTALPAYTLARKPDTDAIGRLSEQGFGGNKRAGNIVFFAKVITLSLFHKLLPKIFPKPALLQLNQADVGYAEIETQWKAQERQLWGMAIGLIVIVLLIAGKVMV